MKFEIGDVVQESSDKEFWFKRNSKKMTVSSFSEKDNEVVCVWFDDEQHYCKGIFKDVFLVRE